MEQDSLHQDSLEKKSPLRGWLMLSFILFCMWAVIWKGTPHLVEAIPALKHYGKVAEENDIMPGVLYYNDVPITVEAEAHNRESVRFAEGLRERAK